MLRCVLALLALVSQLALGSITQTSRAEAATSARIAASVLLCVPGHHDHAAPDDRSHRHPKGIVVAQSASLSLPAVLLPASPIGPAAPPTGQERARGSPPPPAPPAAFASTVRARAPPVPA